MRESQKKTIDGTEYEVTMLGAKDAKKTLLKILKVVAPTAAEGIGSVASLRELLGPDSKFGLAEAIRTFVDRVDEPTLIEVTEQLAGVTRVHLGKEAPLLSDVYDVHFAGSLFAESKWFAFALKAQYADFLQGLGTIEELASRVLGAAAGSSGSQEE